MFLQFEPIRKIPRHAVNFSTLRRSVPFFSRPLSLHNRWFIPVLFKTLISIELEFERSSSSKQLRKISTVTKFLDEASPFPRLIPPFIHLLQLSVRLFSAGRLSYRNLPSNNRSIPSQDLIPPPHHCDSTAFHRLSLRSHFIFYSALSAPTHALPP